MLILGLLLVVISGAAAVVLIAYNTGGTAETVTAFGRDLGDVTLMQAFVAGIVVALVFLIGLWMVFKAGRRGRENRARYKAARRDAKTAAAERDEMAERLHSEEEKHGTRRPVEQTGTGQPTQPIPTGQQTQQAPGQSTQASGTPVRQAPGQPTQQAADPTGQPAPPPSGTQDTGGRHATDQQRAITNIHPGQSPTR